MRKYFFLAYLIIHSTSLSGQLNQQLHEHVLKTPKTSDVDYLLTYLVKGANSEKETAEVLAYWIAENIEYDVDGFSTNTYQSSDWKVTFETKKAVCTGYANLYKEFCKRLNLKCEVVSGYAKGFDHVAKTTFKRSNHAWNLIYIDGESFLVDLTWASGGVDYVHGKLEFFKLFKPELIFGKPEVFIENHLPTQRRWQLLSYPISYEDFTQLYKYEEMCDSTSILYDFSEDIGSYFDLSEIEQRIENVREQEIVNANDSDIPNHYESIAYILARKTTSKDTLKQAKKFYLKARELYPRGIDKQRCNQGIKFVEYYLKL